MRITPKVALLLILVLAGCSVPGRGGAPPTPQRSAQPNIILILVDDMDMSLLAFMPKLKQLLAERGTSFSNFFVNDPACCPSRAAILRGQYAHNTGVLANEGQLGGFPAFLQGGMEESTVATWLQAAGYETILIGKYLNGYPQRTDPAHVPPGWSDWNGLLSGEEEPESSDEGLDEHAGADHAGAEGDPYFSYDLNQNGRLVSYGPGAADYQTDVLTRLALERIQRATTAQRPFFLYLAPFAPHMPATPAPRHAGLFADVQLPRPPSFNEQDISDKPALFQRLKPLNDKKIAHYQDNYRRRAQSVQALDELVEQLVDALEGSHELDRTYLFFASDNGFHMGQHRFPPTKFTAYEEDIHVPLIVRGPGIPAGKIVDVLALNSDLAPTFAELAGVVPPNFVDGRSLLPLLGLHPLQEQPRRQQFLVEYWFSPTAREELLRREPGSIPTHGQKHGQQVVFSANQYMALRTRRYTYVEHHRGDVELYDLEVDPYELENIAATSDPALRNELAAQMRALASCEGADCRRLEEKGP